METFDFVVAGGGSAGCVVAHRLAEEPGNRVLLLEEGPGTNRLAVTVPAGFVATTRNPALNWFYQAQPDPTANGRALVWSSGKGLGGGSAINGMVYIRGASHDYDAWSEMGCMGWSWDEVLPYFLKAETFEGPPTPFHGRSGPLGVAPLRVVHPLARAFLSACGQVGIPPIDDYCAGNIDGAYINLATQRAGRRSSTAAAYLSRSGSNLKVVTGATVDRVVFDEGRASGVAYRLGDREVLVRANAGVVVSAGSIQSPAILMRSGVGPGEQLRNHGIEVVWHAPEVGRNLHDHVTMMNSRFTSGLTYNAIRNPFRLAGEGLKYIFARKGVLSTCAVHAQAHGRSRAGLSRPDIKLQMLPFITDRMSGGAHARSGMAITIEDLVPKTRGEIRLASADPTHQPIIDYRMFGDADDLAVLRAGVRLTDRIFEAPPLAAHVVEPYLPAPGLDDDALDDAIRSSVGIGMHPVATCRMGGDEASVVDPQLRVRGVAGLNVIDASIMPVIPSGNTNAPAIMIGEKGAAMMLAASR